jgi:hypothetical protein
MKLFLTGLFVFFGLNIYSADTTLINLHFDKIIKTDKSRNFENTDVLDEVAAYIFSVFEIYGDSTCYQNYKADGRVYKNVITSFGPKDSPRIIVGAHYDVCGDQDGADDNASGVVGILELARMLKNQPLNYRIDLVAYSLEEPPYFRTSDMGSYRHAEYLYNNDIDVYGMIALDMIGYFSDEKNSQKYPLGILKLIYGNKGNFITVVRKFNDGKFASRTKRKFKKSDQVKVKSFQAPARLPGIDFSDHINYWRFGYSAVFITDSGFFRNPNYHKSGDTLETLDMERLADVIDALFELLIDIQDSGKGNN